MDIETPKNKTLEPALAATGSDGTSLGRKLPFLSIMGRKEVRYSVFTLILFLLALEWGPGALGIPEFMIPRLSDVVKEIPYLYSNSNLLGHILSTSFAVAVGFVMGALLGAVMGYFLGMSPTVEFVASPYILALQIAPKVAFAPLFVMWFGYTLAPKVLVAMLIVFFPILINVLTAVRGVDPAMVNLARSFKATRRQIFWKIEFPSSMPALFSGLRIGSTLAVIGVVVGEFVGGNTGLGFLLVEAEGRASAPSVFATILILTLIGIVAYLLVILAERWVLRYMPKRNFGEVGGT